MAAGVTAAVGSHQILHVAGDLAILPSAYEGYAHAGLIPMAMLAAAFGLFATISALADAGRSTSTMDSWLRDAAKTIACQRWGSVASLITLIQIATLYGMESIEQFLAFGHPLGGLAWLGGPPLIALLIHVGVSLLTVTGLIAMMRGIAHACRIVRTLISIRIIRSRDALPPKLSQRRAFRPIRRLDVPARRLFKRGPPVLV